VNAEAQFAHHPAAQIPPDNTVIWRYFGMPKLISLFADHALFFSRSDKLGDPFEGTFPVQNLNPSYESVAEVVGTHIAHVAGEKERLTQKFLNSVGELRPKTLINCWYASEHESAAMWGLYAREEGAACIKSSVGRLKYALHHENAKSDVFVGSVRYIDYAAGEIPMTNLLHAFWTKRISFAQEHEVRAILPEHLADVGMLVDVHLETLVEAIYVSPTADSWIKELLEDIAARYAIAAEIRRSSLGSDPIT